MRSDANGVAVEPTVVVVHGASGSGKTHLARILAQNLGLPLIAKDDFKELLFERLGWREDRDHSRLLGRLSMDLLYRSMELLLRVPADFIVEAKFDPDLAASDFSELMSRRPFQVIQVLCRAAPEVRLRRIRDRVQTELRHPGHIDHIYLDELTRLPADGLGAIALPGDVHMIDTSDEAEEAVRQLVTLLQASVAEEQDEPSSRC